ncbi:MAG: ECF transporter S component [Eubacteriales bacterium]|nr:ECF transporter S component [Eubacteriales bacterium]
MRNSLQKIILTALFIALTIAIQMLGFPQPVTGPLVNCMLLLSALFAGPIAGILVGLVTPWIAFLRGILAAPLAPMLPFIMLSNGVYVLCFYLGRKLLGKKVLGSAVGIIGGAAVKFLLLSGAVNFLVRVPDKIAKAMQFPQLLTAIAGGIIAVIAAELIARAGRKEEF